MDFASADPSIIKSIRQRYLLNEWLRLAGKRPPIPFQRDFQLDRVDDETADMMGYDVIGEADGARFLITHQGARLATTYGNERVDPGELRRFLDEAIGPERYANVVDIYRTCLRHKRPVYSISKVDDADGKEVSYERLLMPFGEGEAVQQIIGSFKSISIEGGFKVSNLMGLRPKAKPVILVRAIIDRQFVPAAAPTNTPSSGEIVELD
jgi:hypothetical protein